MHTRSFPELEPLIVWLRADGVLNTSSGRRPYPDQGGLKMNQHGPIPRLRGLDLPLGLPLVSACQAREPSLSGPATARVSGSPKESRR